MTNLLRRLRYLIHQDEEASGLDEEMRLHVELRTRRLAEQGMAPDQARVAARRQFGNRASLEVAGAEVWGVAFWDRLIQDLRYALRSLRKSPGFAAVAVATLAVGIGMNTAVFSIVNGVMLRRLPYPDPDRLVSLWEETSRNPSILHTSGGNLGAAGEKRRTTVSPANLIDYRQGTTAFEGLAGVDRTLMNLTGLGAPDRIYGESVTANYFELAGAKPVLGRTFTAEEDQPGAPHVVVLAFEFWQRKLGGDTDVLDRKIMLDGVPYQVIGVLPRGFQPVSKFVITTEPILYFVPAAYSKELLNSHGDHEVDVLARLKPGVSIQTAQSQLDAVSASLGQRHPQSNQGVRAVLTPLLDDVVSQFRDSLTALLGASALIVLITCVNVANLLLVRAVARRHETSVRLALGAARTRILRAFLTESMLVSAAGCIAGVLLGAVLMRLLVAAAPANIPRLDAIDMDWRVFAVAAAIATITGLIFGLAPAWQASRARPAESLKTTERRGSRTAQARWRGIFTAAEVALSLMLLVGAGLFLKSFAKIMGIDLGFQTERVLAMNINLPNAHYATASQRLAFYDDLETRVRGLPGVQAVAYANRLPLRGGWSTGIQIENIDAQCQADSQAVNPDYFETLGIPLLRGRLLTTADRNGAPYVAVVNQAFARIFLNNTDPIGRRFRRGPDAMWISVVGVVNDIRRDGKMMKDINPQIYIPAAQTDAYPVRIADFAVRTAGDPHLLLHAIQQQVWAIDKDQPITNVRTMDEIITRRVAEQRFEMLLLTVFAGVAVILAVIGVFGALSYSVDQRMNEFGVRVALGASPAHVLSLVLKQAGALIAGGIAVGLAGAWALTRLIGHLLFHVEPHDTATYIAAAAALSAIAFLAAAVPALRGARVDPVSALRYE